MKKFAGIMVATVLAFSLVACGPVDSAVQNLAGAASNKGSGVVTADDDGYAEGRIGVRICQGYVVRMPGM